MDQKIETDERIGATAAALIGEMKAVFDQDTRRIEHALAVLRFAEGIQQSEGGDPLVVQAAAILHDIGIHEAERKYGSAAGRYQELEGPPIAEEILSRQRLDAGSIQHVCRIIANHHSARDIDTLEFRILWDADWLVNFNEFHGNESVAARRAAIYRIFKTPTGRSLAATLYANDVANDTMEAER